MPKIYLPAIAAVFILLLYLIGVVWLPGPKLVTIFGYLLQMLGFPILVTVGLGQLVFVGWTWQRRSRPIHIVTASLIILLCQGIFYAFFTHGYVLTA